MMKVIEGEGDKNQIVKFDKKSGAPYIDVSDLISAVKYRSDEFDLKVKKSNIRGKINLWLTVNGQRLGIKL